MRVIIIAVMVVCFITGCSKSVEKDLPDATNSVSLDVGSLECSGLLPDKTKVSGQMR